MNGGTFDNEGEGRVLDRHATLILKVGGFQRFRVVRRGFWYMLLGKNQARIGLGPKPAGAVTEQEEPRTTHGGAEPAW